MVLGQNDDRSFRRRAAGIGNPHQNAEFIDSKISQAAFQWRKSFSEQRPPHFLYILVTHLVSQQKTESDLNKQVQRSLAYQNLKKSIDATQGKVCTTLTVALARMAPFSNPANGCKGTGQICLGNSHVRGSFIARQDLSRARKVRGGVSIS